MSALGFGRDLAGKAAGGRKLVAVVYADMVGYSRLISLDDAGTLRRLRTMRRALIDPTIREHGGSVVQTGGDSLLVAFDSIDGAVRCAVKVQQQVPVYDGDQPADRRIRFRIGINIGDVIPDGTDLHGEGVNIAARLEAECPVGGICVSRTVRDHVHGRLDLTFEPLGELTLKNIARPVEAFVLRLGPTAGAGEVSRPAQRGEPSGPRAGGMEATQSTLLTGRPSIAVLPFANLSGNPDEEYFSEGLADDIITALSRSRSLLVVARNSSFTFKGRAIEVKQVAGELGVRYVVEGSARRAAGRVRVNAQLIDAETGIHVWAERYDREVGDVFAVQDEITQALTAAINPAVAEAELRRALRKPPENLGAWEAYQRGLWHARKATAVDNEQALSFFRRSMELDPTFASPHAMLAYYYGWGFASGGILPVDQISKVAEQEARRAIELDPNDTTALAALSWLSVCEGDSRGALERAERAISAAPNDAVAWLAKARILQFSGRPKEALIANQTALRLNPVGPTNWIIEMGLTISHYFERDYDAAVEAAQRAIRDHPEVASPYRWLAAALGQLGQHDAARAALRKAIAVSPESFAFYVHGRPPWFRPEDNEHLLEGLHKAGWKD